jgi:hypothetical protein
MAKNLDYYKKLLVEQSIKLNGTKSPLMAVPKNQFDEVLERCFLGNG